MSEATVIPPGGGEVVGDSPDRRVEILCDHEALNATWSRFGPRREGADPHVHRRHTDLFYVLQGELTLLLGPEGDPVTAPAGTVVCVPPLVVHGFRNGTDAELRYLNFHAPGVGFADYMRAMRDGRKLAYDQYEPPADGGRPPSEAIIRAGAIEGDGIAISEGGAKHGATSSSELVAYYVLGGELALTAGDEQMKAQPGSWVQIPPGVPHEVSKPARCVQIRARMP